MFPSMFIFVLFDLFLKYICTVTNLSYHRLVEIVLMNHMPGKVGSI